MPVRVDGTARQRSVGVGQGPRDFTRVGVREDFHHHFQLAGIALGAGGLLQAQHQRQGAEGCKVCLCVSFVQFEGGQSILLFCSSVACVAKGAQHQQHVGHRRGAVAVDIFRTRRGVHARRGHVGPRHVIQRRGVGASCKLARVVVFRGVGIVVERARGNGIPATAVTGW